MQGNQGSINTIITGLAKKIDAASVYTRDDADGRFLKRRERAADSNLLAGKSVGYFASGADLNSTNAALDNLIQQLTTAFDEGVIKINGG